MNRKTSGTFSTTVFATEAAKTSILLSNVTPASAQLRMSPAASATADVTTIRTVPNFLCSLESGSTIGVCKRRIAAGISTHATQPTAAIENG